jgi:hypothetical protein
MAALSGSLTGSTISAAMRWAVGQAAGSVASADVVALTEEALKAMMLTKLKNVCLVLLFVAIAGLAAGGLFFRAGAQQGEPAQRPAQAVTGKKPDIAEIADVLKIVRKSGQVTLREGHRSGFLLIEFYQEGQKQAETLRGAGYSLGALAKEHRYDRVEFALQALDLDYLTLADGKKDHCRVLLVANVPGPAGPIGMTTHDVPKERFNFARATSGGYFPAEASSGKVIPLFYVGYGPGGFGGGLSVPAVVEANRRGHVAVVSLHIDEDDE